MVYLRVAALRRSWRLLRPRAGRSDHRSDYDSRITSAVGCILIIPPAGRNWTGTIRQPTFCLKYELSART
jgi:hypothetical protein